MACTLVFMDNTSALVNTCFETRVVMLSNIYYYLLVYENRPQLVNRKGIAFNHDNAKTHTS